MLFALYGYCKRYKLENVDLKKINSFPLYHISVRDSCVSQNKSNVTMKYACFQSLFFSERFILIIFLPGHIHVAGDRAIAHAKTALKLKNLFYPSDIPSEMSTIKRISCKFTNQEDIFCPAFTGWKPLLEKCFLKMPANFTSNFIFEFYEGKCE